MARFRWDGAAGDDSPGGKKLNWAPELPPPPREVYPLLDRATAAGLWLKWARNPRVLASWGARYRLTRAGGNAVVFASDDLEAIRECLEEFEGTA